MLNYLIMSMFGRTLISPVRAHLMRATCCLARLIDNVVTLILDPGSREFRESIFRSIWFRSSETGETMHDADATR